MPGHGVQESGRAILEIRRIRTVAHRATNRAVVSRRERAVTG